MHAFSHVHCVGGVLIVVDHNLTAELRHDVGMEKGYVICSWGFVKGYVGTIYFIDPGLRKHHALVVH